MQKHAKKLSSRLRTLLFTCFVRIKLSNNMKCIKLNNMKNIFNIFYIQYILYILYNIYSLCYYSCPIFFLSPLFPFALYPYPPTIPPPQFISMGHTYMFFGFSISHTILNLLLSILYLQFMLLIPSTFPPIILPFSSC